MSVPRCIEADFRGRTLGGERLTRSTNSTFFVARGLKKGKKETQVSNKVFFVTPTGLVETEVLFYCASILYRVTYLDFFGNP